MVSKSDWHMDTVRTWEDNVVSNKAKLLAHFASKSVVLERPAELRLDFDEKGRAYVFTKQADGNPAFVGIGVGFALTGSA